MNDLVIETRGLRKEFRSLRGRHVVAVQGLDLAVRRGGVHGFLGPNGSGKTTTLRMLLGLASASAGEMRLFGEPVPRRLPRLMHRVGAVVEHPRFLPSLTGHGVGLEIDEDPQLAPTAMGKLDACVPVTVEPGVHLPGRGGVRIDDTLVVRPEADGGPELLTITTKELLAL